MFTFAKNNPYNKKNFYYDKLSDPILGYLIFVINEDNLTATGFEFEEYTNDKLLLGEAITRLKSKIFEDICSRLKSSDAKQFESLLLLSLGALTEKNPPNTIVLTLDALFIIYGKAKKINQRVQFISAEKSNVESSSSASHDLLSEDEKQKYFDLITYMIIFVLLLLVPKNEETSLATEKLSAIPSCLDRLAEMSKLLAENAKLELQHFLRVIQLGNFEDARRLINSWEMRAKKNDICNTKEVSEIVCQNLSELKGKFQSNEKARSLFARHIINCINAVNGISRVSNQETPLPHPIATISASTVTSTSSSVTNDRNHQFTESEDISDPDDVMERDVSGKEPVILDNNKLVEHKKRTPHEMWPGQKRKASESEPDNTRVASKAIKTDSRSDRSLSHLNSSSSLWRPASPKVHEKQFEAALTLSLLSKDQVYGNFEEKEPDYDDTQKEYQEALNAAIAKSLSELK